jgi:hypothetical protein
MQKLNKTLNQENGGVKPELNTSFFKFFVGNGNNHPIVKQILKRRSWWHKQRSERFIGSNPIPIAYNSDGTNDEAELSDREGAEGNGAHFIWTAWRKTEHTEFIQQNL